MSANTASVHQEGQGTKDLGQITAKTGAFSKGTA